MEIIESICSSTPVKRSQRLIEAMQDVVCTHKLELMQRYPNDLIVHDRRVLNDLGAASATIGWCVGDSHTHMAILGIHPDENKMIDHFLNLSSSDRFYKIVLVGAEDFKLTEQSKEQFIQLKSTKVPYSKKGDHLNFRLYKDETAIFDISITFDGGYQNRQYSIKYQSLTTTGLVIDDCAAECWAHKGIASYSGSLFYRVKSSTWLHL